MAHFDFNEIFSTYAGKLRQVAFCIIKDNHLAEDIVQETFIKAYKKIHTIEDQTKIGAWLSAIAGRTAIDFLRAEKRDKWHPADQMIMEKCICSIGFTASTEKEIESRLMEEEMNSALLRLKDRYKEVLVLRLKYDLKEEEIASVLNLKSGTVKARLYRGRKHLKKLMEEKYPA